MNTDLMSPAEFAAKVVATQIEGKFADDILRTVFNVPHVRGELVKPLRAEPPSAWDLVPDVRRFG
jgi:hypothetical protein